MPTNSTSFGGSSSNGAIRLPSSRKPVARISPKKSGAEREILLAYLPAQRSAEEIREIVQSVLAELPAEQRNAGAVMKVVMPQLRGLADGNLVRQIVTEELQRVTFGVSA